MADDEDFLAVGEGGGEGVGGAAGGEGEAVAEGVGVEGEVEGGEVEAVESLADSLDGGVVPGEDFGDFEGFAGEIRRGGVARVEMGAGGEFGQAEAFGEQAEGAGFPQGFGGLEEIGSDGFGVADFGRGFFVGREFEADASVDGYDLWGGLLPGFRQGLHQQEDFLDFSGGGDHVEFADFRDLRQGAGDVGHRGDFGQDAVGFFEQQGQDFQ